MLCGESKSLNIKCVRLMICLPGSGIYENEHCMLTFTKSAKACESGLALPRIKKLRLHLRNGYVIDLNSYLAISPRISYITYIETYPYACVMVGIHMIIMIVRRIRHNADTAL
jgi:hypothetical protein